jgi:hypothetical protein
MISGGLLRRCKSWDASSSSRLINSHCRKFGGRGGIFCSPSLFHLIIIEPAGSKIEIAAVRVLLDTAGCGMEKEAGIDRCCIAGQCFQN